VGQFSVKFIAGSGSVLGDRQHPLSGFPNFDLLRLDYANSLRLEGLR
jgi:hypothetical protein